MESKRSPSAWVPAKSSYPRACHIINNVAERRVILAKSVANLEGDKRSKHLRRVVFRDNDTLDCDALFFNLGIELTSDPHEMLGCRLDPECGLVWVDETQQTSVPGVYAAGDITPNSQLAIVAAAEGAMAAIQIHRSLIPEERKA